MSIINTFKGIIIDIDLLTLSRNIPYRKAKIIENIITSCKRSPLKKRGYILSDAFENQNDSSLEIKTPRQEPLEHAWKKLNL